jgi:hypothetical protein
MKKINYNLAGGRRIHASAFALRAGLLLLASLLLGALAVSNLLRLQARNRAEKSETVSIASRLEEMKSRGARLQEEIAAWKKSWLGELTASNLLIVRKSFSFVARLDFLEKNFSPGIRIRQLTLLNNPGGLVLMNISARSLKGLFALYKKLAPYDLVITSETQTQDEYQVNLQFKISNEKI